MNNKAKRKSVFKILLTRIFAIVILFNIIQAGLNINETVSLQKRSEEMRKQKVQDEIISIIDSWNSVLKSIETTFYTIQSKAVHKLINLQPVHDLKSVDLSKQLVLLELDSTFHDFYIIEDGIIVNTTYSPDLGLNFYDFGEKHKEFLFHVLETGNFTPERFELESSTRRLKCYSYQATEDREYIIEIGSYSETADLIMQMFRDRLTRIIEENADILSVNFWIGSEDAQIGFLDDPVIYDLQDSLIVQADQMKTEIEKRFEKDDRLMTADFIYLELEKSTQSFSDVVVSIITDITDHNVPVYNIIKKQVLITLVFLTLLLLVLILATRSLKFVLRDLLQKTTAIAQGSLHERVKVTGENEFTTLAEHFNHMVENLETSYKELNQKNILIEDKNKILEDQNEEITAQRDEIEAQRDEIEAQRNYALEQKELLAKQKEAIMDSINYAQRIQQAILPQESEVNEILPENFIVFKPRDIVSGDFYWMTQVEKQTIIAAVDCTGHGVPGAFMSMLGAAFLNEIVNKEYITHPGVILRRMRKEVIRALQQKGVSGEQKDGMDIALCSIDFETMHLQFAGANNPLYVIRKKELDAIAGAKSMENSHYILYEVRGDRMPIAIHERMDKFTTHEINLKKGDILYVFSDGYADQFGGNEGKKFKYKTFKELILENCEKTMQEQKTIMEKTLEEWQGTYEQLDDILVLGFKTN